MITEKDQRYIEEIATNVFNLLNKTTAAPLVVLAALTHVCASCLIDFKREEVSLVESSEAFGRSLTIYIKSFAEEN